MNRRQIMLGIAAGVTAVGIPFQSKADFSQLVTFTRKVGTPRLAVPQGVVDELSTFYTNVEFDLSSEITESTVSRKLRYRERANELITSEVVDPRTFEPKEVTGYPTKSFFVRLEVVGDDNCIVRRLFSADTITKT